jgi:hypothetical protein
VNSYVEIVKGGVSRNGYFLKSFKSNQIRGSAAFFPEKNYVKIVKVCLTKWIYLKVLLIKTDSVALFLCIICENCVGMSHDVDIF